MSQIISVRGFTPKVPESCFIADNSRIIGDVEMGENCSVWYNAVIRGDVNSIRIGNKVNIQDGAIIHCTYEKAGTFIGDNVSIGHQAMVHGCTIKNNVLVGMGAIIMDKAVVEENVLIAAGAVVLENSHLESGYIYGGVPAKRLKKLDEESMQFHITRTADNYVKYSGWFKDEE
ncbi:gamma carbonic anhydrase family protein [Portibacter lacus]|uniref:Gamma carbonic anhydrase family protein n=1 Tax=Portibacter lacus TaxID=1099794 RepID=A0AA37SS43_9BACT|nr:gamma carbonic anhydrase family protein [Portibacter lacus]GLR17796.1 gamma carbonic anhydrase family protein [Portibacter lacus]